MDAGSSGREAIARLIGASIRLNRPICFDTPAVIAFLQGNLQFVDLIVPILESPRVPVVLSTVTMCEIMTGPARYGDELSMHRISRGLSRLPRMSIVPFDDRVAFQAAIVRASTGLKLPDAGVVATGIIESAIAIVGNDARWGSKLLGLPYVHLSDFAAAD